MLTPQQLDSCPTGVLFWDKMGQNRLKYCSTASCAVPTCPTPGTKWDKWDKVGQVGQFSVIVAHLLPLSHSQQRVVQGVQPFASNFNERCNYTTLTLKG